MVQNRFTCTHRKCSFGDKVKCITMFILKENKNTIIDTIIDDAIICQEEGEH